MSAVAVTSTTSSSAATAAATVPALPRERTFKATFVSPTKKSQKNVPYRNVHMRDHDSGELVEVLGFGDTSNPLRDVVHGGTYRAVNATVAPKPFSPDRRPDAARFEIKAGTGTTFDLVAAPPDPRLADDRKRLADLKGLVDHRDDPLHGCLNKRLVVDVVGIVQRVGPAGEVRMRGASQPKRVVRIVDESWRYGINLQLMAGWANAMPELIKLELESAGLYPYVLAVHRAGLDRFRKDREPELTAWDSSCSVTLYDPRTCAWAMDMVDECMAAGMLQEHLVLGHLAAADTESSSSSAAAAAEPSRAVAADHAAKRPRVMEPPAPAAVEAAS